MTVSCASDDGTSANQRLAQSISVAEVRDFDEFDLFWLSEGFSGHRLRNISLLDPVSVSFSYGDCDVPQEPEGNCLLPLSVRVISRCSRSENSVPHTQPIGNLRGIPIYAYGSTDAFFWTSDVYVRVIVAPNVSLPIQDVVNALESVDPSGVKAGEDFPAVTECHHGSRT